jgi:hypothetical protein
MTKFNAATLEAIKTDPVLFVAVATEMGINPGSLKMAIQRNGYSLNQYSVVMIVASHLGKEPQELLEKDIPEMDVAGQK